MSKHTTPSDTASALELGLLRFPRQGEEFRGRKGEPKPFLIDARGAGTNLPLRDLIVRLMGAYLTDVPGVDVVGGLAKSGTTWGAWLAWQHRMAFATILLDGPRKSGAQREVEGDVSGKTVVLIDNWCRSGKSISVAADVVARAGGVVAAAIVIVAERDVTFPFPLIPVWYISDIAPIRKPGDIGRE